MIRLGSRASSARRSVSHRSGSCFLSALFFSAEARLRPGRISADFPDPRGARAGKRAGRCPARSGRPASWPRPRFLQPCPCTGQDRRAAALSSRHAAAAEVGGAAVGGGSEGRRSEEKDQQGRREDSGGFEEVHGILPWKGFQALRNVDAMEKFCAGNLLIELNAPVDYLHLLPPRGRPYLFFRKRTAKKRLRGKSVRLTAL